MWVAGPGHTATKKMLKHVQRMLKNVQKMLKNVQKITRKNIATGETSQAITSLAIKTFIN